MTMVRNKRLVRFMKEFPQYELLFKMERLPEFVSVYTAANWSGDPVSRRSTSGGLVLLESCLVASWSRTQASVAMSSAESEFYAMISGLNEAKAVTTLLEELQLGQLQIRILSDSQAARGTVLRRGALKMRHMALRFLYMKELMRTGSVSIQYIRSETNPSDMLTKPVTAAVLSQCLRQLSCWKPRELSTDAQRSEDPCTVQM